MTISKFISNVLISLTFLAFLAQFVIDFSTINIATSCIILTSAISTLLYFRWTKALDTHPLSSFAIFGFCFTSILGALLAQSASWIPVSAHLYQPLVTFSILSMYQAIALVAHSIYRGIRASSSHKIGLVRNVFSVIGVYVTPSAQLLWIMGGSGVFCLLLSNFSPVAKGVSFLAWSPFLIPIYAQIEGTQYCSTKRNYLFLIAFAALIAVIAMIFNARGILLTGGATVGLLFLLVGMRSKNLVTSPMLLRLSMVCLFGIVLSWPASNLVTAMAVTRIDRGKVSASEMVTKTIENFQSPEKLESYKKSQLAEKIIGAYDENYIINPMVARLVTTKFHDNALYFAGKVTEKESEETMHVTGDFFLALLPQPFLDVLKIDVNKDDMYFSMGDLLANFVIGTRLSGLRTGSIFGHGWVLFGYYFPLIYFAMCFVLFVSLDIFSTRTKTGVTILSVIGMLNVWPNFLFGITAESLQHLFGAVARGILQSVLMYSILFAIARLISNLISKLMHAKPLANAEFVVK